MAKDLMDRARKQDGDWDFAQGMTLPETRLIHRDTEEGLVEAEDEDGEEEEDLVVDMVVSIAKFILKSQEEPCSRTKQGF